MGQKGRLRNLSLGAFAGLSIVGLIASGAYASMYCELNNPNQTYYPGSLRSLGTLAYVVAVTSFVSLGIYFIAFFFIMFDCCKCFKIFLIIIGFLVWLVCFISEIIFIGLNHWNLNEHIQSSILDNEYIHSYSLSFIERVQYAYYEDEFIDAYTGNYSSIMFNEKIEELIGIEKVPTYGKIEALVNTSNGVVQKIIKMPVCFFANEFDKANFVVQNCIGRWNGERLRNAIKCIEESIANKNTREQDWNANRINKWNFRWILYHLIMYSTTGAYGILPIFLGIQIGAFVFGFFFVIISMLSCCCRRCDCCKDDKTSSD